MLGIGLGQPLAQQPIEAGIEPAVQAGVGAGNKTAAALVTAAGTRIELADAPVDRPGNGRVITDLEMEVLLLHITAPVAAPELVAVVHAEGHG